MRFSTMISLDLMVNRLIAAVVVVGIGILALDLKQGQGDEPLRPEVMQWLKALEAECDPATLGNDYEWSQSTQPTERRRMELLNKLNAHPRETAAAISRLALNPAVNDEHAQMLTLARLEAKDLPSVQRVCRLMVWSGYPAVRICAARLLRELKNPACDEWFTLALQDERVVMNNACGLDADGRIYPVRLIAELALRDLKGP